MTGASLPAVVLGIDTPIGLAIVRDLGRHGVAVTGLARGQGALGLGSRYLARGLLRASGEAALLAQLEELGAALGQACLFTVSESDISMLNRHRAQLARHFHLMFPDQRRMERVLDKQKTYAAAQAVGVPVPRSWQPDNAAGLAAGAAGLQYPVVVKWADPHAAAPHLRAAGLAADKARYCHSAAELVAYLTPYGAAGCYPLVQEYCPGYGLGQFMLMRDGQAHCLFQHRRLHEWPPEGGVSTLCESLPLSQHSALMAQSVALLRALEWEGIAMVEYRHDPASGRSALMEINGRFWGSLPLAVAAGAHFPWHAYQLLGQGRAPTAAPYRAGLRCRFMVPETKRLLRLLFRPQAVADRSLPRRPLAELLAYLSDFLRPSTRYYVFQWRDPGPFWRDLRQMLRR
ncbi:MAG: carboxylate--amine ligase [Pseudoduganella sp.]|jgi:predicted ATP-grasp superfamily ATP-dependent carboligase|nr:carboxylate--amine ligase [Pseudoduganella sp.]